MTHTNIQVTTEELKLLIALSSDQLFRREFIDPKMPGHKAKPAEISLGKSLVTRMRGILDPSSIKKAPIVKKAS